jgi:hypothetical protein
MQADTQSRALRVPEVMPTSAAERQQQLATLKQVRAGSSAFPPRGDEAARCSTPTPLHPVGVSHGCSR